MTESFSQDEYETRVVFRMLGEEVIALFIDDPANPDAYFCNSFVHVGQHGAADPWLVVEKSRPATEEEYYSLKDELERHPYTYRLRVLKRIPRNALDNRRKEVAAWAIPREEGAT